MNYFLLISPNFVIKTFCKIDKLHYQVKYKVFQFKFILAESLIDCGLTPFSKMFCHITAASSPIHVFPGFLTPVIHTTILPSNWLLFHINCQPIGFSRVNKMCRMLLNILRNTSSISGLLALNGQLISGEVYAWVAVFVLPINSAINPFLYTLGSSLSQAVRR